MSETQPNLGRFARVPCRAASLPLTRTAFRVLIGLGRFIDSAGQCFPAYEALATATAIDPRHLSSALAELERAGLISRIRRPGTSTIYTVRFAAADLAGGDDEAAPEVTPPEVLAPGEVITSGGVGGTPWEVYGGDTPPGAITSQDSNQPKEQPKEVKTPSQEGKFSGEETPPKAKAAKAPKADNPLRPDFLRFYDNFPSDHKAAGAAQNNTEKLFYKIVRGGKATVADLMHGLGLYLASKRVADGYACAPHKWLAEERWKLPHGGGGAAWDGPNHGRQRQQSPHGSMFNGFARAAGKRPAGGFDAAADLYNRMGGDDGDDFDAI